jgi:hypothetical protein
MTSRARRFGEHQDDGNPRAATGEAARALLFFSRQRSGSVLDNTDDDRLHDHFPVVAIRYFRW